MADISVHDGQFWINGRPQLIQAGEFHYFRTPPDQWAHRLGLLKGAGFNTLASYIPWLWHQIEEDVTDLDGHSQPMRNLAGFLDMAAGMGFWIIARPGPYIMAETINEGIPPWVFRNYPQVAFTGQDGKPQNIASYLHPDFLACVSKWYCEVFQVIAPRQITRGGKIIMTQLDNEMGMLPWLRNIIDINPDTVTRFARYLAGQYGDRLAERYPTADLESFLKEKISCPEAVTGSNLVEDYRRFYRQYLREYASWLAREARANGLDTPPVINIHGFGNGGKTFPIGLSQLIEVMGIDGIVSATDVYPLHIGEGNIHQIVLVNEMTRALQNKQQALFSIEFQAGGNSDFGGSQSSLYDLHTRASVSLGMRAINHYLFSDGENDPVLSPVKRHDWGHPIRKDGTLRKHYDRYGMLSKVLNCYGSALVQAKPQTVATVGFLLDYFMTEVNNVFTQEYTSRITHQRDVILFDMIARGLTLTHRPFDAVELTRGDLDAGKIPMLWAMMDQQCDAETQQKLVDYIRQGGRLVIIGRMCQETFDHRPCTILKEALGIETIESDPPFQPGLICAFQWSDIPVSFIETYTGAFDEVIARQENRKTTGFIKALGKGKVLLLGAAMAANTLDDLDVFEEIAVRMDCLRMFLLSAWVDVRMSRGAQGGFLYINNYQDDPVETTITCGGEALFGGHLIRLAARRGAILPVDWKYREGIFIHYVTSEIVEISDNWDTVTLKMDQCTFTAELTLSGYSCDQAEIMNTTGNQQRIRVYGNHGDIHLRKSA